MQHKLAAVFAQPYKVKVTHWNKLQAAAANSPWQAARSMCTATSPTEESCDQKGTTQHKLAAAFCTTPHGKGDRLQAASAKRAAVRRPFEARYSCKETKMPRNRTTQHQRLRKQFLTPHDDVTTKGKLWPKDSTQRSPAAVSCTAPHGSTPPRENCDQKALHSKTPLQSLARTLGSRKHRYARVILTPNTTSLKAS
ncbi:hypothetical protein ACFX1Z_024253 [Malus domestica]